MTRVCVVPVKAHSHLFHVLRLSPGPMAPPTPFDIILPAVAAFCNSVEKVQASQSQYPTFTPSTCGWHAIFEQIIHLALLWDCWGPGSLGEYPDVFTLWKSWDEGWQLRGSDKGHRYDLWMHGGAATGTCAQRRVTSQHGDPGMMITFAVSINVPRKTAHHPP